jgi:hypothetical protein
MTGDGEEKTWSKFKYDEREGGKDGSNNVCTSTQNGGLPIDDVTRSTTDVVRIVYGGACVLFTPKTRTGR